MVNYVPYLKVLIIILFYNLETIRSRWVYPFKNIRCYIKVYEQCRVMLNRRALKVSFKSKRME